MIDKRAIAITASETVVKVVAAAPTSEFLIKMHIARNDVHAYTRARTHKHSHIILFT